MLYVWWLLQGGGGPGGSTCLGQWKVCVSEEGDGTVVLGSGEFHGKLRLLTREKLVLTTLKPEPFPLDIHLPQVHHHKGITKTPVRHGKGSQVGGGEDTPQRCTTRWLPGVGVGPVGSGR